MANHKGKKSNKLFKVLVGVFGTLLTFVLVVGFIGVYFYKSGEMALKSSVQTKAPVIEVDETEVALVRNAYESKAPKALAWQDDWVAYEGMAYEYNEDCLNFLMLGIDRAGELEDETDLSDWSAGQADTIFLVCLNNADQKISVIGIPRNAMVNLEIFNQDKECIDTMYNQICLQYGYAGGGELGLEKMKKVVSELFYDMPIHGACAISYKALAIATDKLGGVEVTVAEDFAEKSHYEAGSKLLLTSDIVETYLRYRDYGELGSPTKRLSRQKEFLKAAMAKAISEIKKNPGIVTEIYQAIEPYMNTDVSLDEAVYLTAEVIDYSLGDSSFYQLTGEDQMVLMNQTGTGEDFYNDYYLDAEALHKVMMEVFYKPVVIE